jgi:predicted site-specific integrase-resolvase
MTDDDTIGVREAARIAGVHENTIRNWAKTGVLESTQLRPKGFRRFSRSQVELVASTRPEPVPTDRTEAFALGYRLGYRDALQDVKMAVGRVEEAARELRSENRL